MSQHSAKGAAWEAQKVRIWERDGWVCTSCGNWVARDNVDPQHDATVDHLDPVSFNPGKAYRDDELTTMCRTCNSRKGARLLVRQNWFSPRYLPNGIPR